MSLVAESRMTFVDEPEQNNGNGKLLKLDIGGGDNPVPGFKSVDKKLGEEAYPLGYQNDSIECVRASHILEHFPFADIKDGDKLIPCAERVLREWVRVLRPGGELFIAVPDMDWIVDHWRDGTTKHHPASYIVGGQTEPSDIHRSIWCEKDLRQLMLHIGLEGIERWKSERNDCASYPVSLNLKGRKSLTSPVETYAENRGGITTPLKICAAMSIPRVGFNDSWGCILQALRPFNIPITRSNGVYWDQCLTRLMEKAIADGVDWMLTIDYDSLFSPQHVSDLIHALGSTPDADAMCALQLKRQCDEALVSIGSDKSCQVGLHPVPVDTAHFGLTLIRLESLKEIPKPWFLGIPGPDNSWNEGRTDPDIHFWRQWKKAGKKVYLAPNVRIGHLEVMVKDYTDELVPRHVYPHEWFKENGFSDSDVRPNK